jgi:hypothetical protein
LVYRENVSSQRACTIGVQEVPGSNPGSPTKFLIDLQPGHHKNFAFGVELESISGIPATTQFQPASKIRF